MLYIAFVISLGFSGMIGYSYREIRESIKKLELQLQKPKKAEESKSMILDPDDPLQEAKRQQNELIRKLNP